MASIKQARRLRQSATLAERALWDLLRGRKLADAKFRRQAPVGRYVADFLCVEKRLIVELDGAVHEGRELYDIERMRQLERFGYLVIRFTNEQVLAPPDKVVDEITAMLNLASAEPLTLPPAARAGPSLSLLERER